MNIILKLEDAGKFFLAYWLSIHLGFEWWVFFVWFLAPDLSMLGYVINPRVGAITYNFAHHQLVAIIVGLVGFYSENTILLMAGIVLFGHSAFDRIFGYGLKYADSFQHTHLGLIGKAGKHTPSR